MRQFHFPQMATLATVLHQVGMHWPQQILLRPCVGCLVSFAHVSVSVKRTRLNRLPAPLHRNPQASNARLQVTPLDIVLRTRTLSTLSATIPAMIGLGLHRPFLQSLRPMTMTLCREWPTPTIRYVPHIFQSDSVFILIPGSDLQKP
jgi:hypothetical protein